jgi:hypothetical protein
MNGAAAQNAKPPTTARPPDKPGERVSSSPTTKRFIPGAAITIAGALITGGLVAAALAPGLLGAKSSTSDSAVEPTLAALPLKDLAAAIPTLDPATSQTAVTEAKSCKAPLAWVVLVRRPGAPASSGMVRVRSGGYLSPPFHVTDVPQWIAVPYPAPYASGRGVLSLVGDASDLWFYLTPGWFNERLNGSASINVVWTPGNPC